MRYHVSLEGRTVEVDLRTEETTVDGEPFASSMVRLPGTRIHSFLLDGRSYRLVSERGAGGRWVIHLAGRKRTVEVIDERTRAIREVTGDRGGPAGATALLAPMPGLVVKVEVEIGQAVEPGDGLVVVEAMKMENELRADAPGIIKAVRVREGDAVEMNDVLLELEAPGEPSGDG